MVETRYELLEGSVKACGEQVQNLITSHQRMEETIAINERESRAATEEVRSEVTEVKDSVDQMKSMLIEMKKCLNNKKKEGSTQHQTNSGNNNSILGAGPGGGQGLRGHQQRRMDFEGFVEEREFQFQKDNDKGNKEDIAGTYKKYLKLEFPKFTGVDCRGWARKCRNFFKYGSVPDKDRVELASMHFEGGAELWYQNYIDELEVLEWDDFVRRVASRFGPQIHENIEAEFANLQQAGTVSEYMEKFEELRVLMKVEIPELTEKYFINNFIKGLKDEIKYRVHVQFSATLSHAISIARVEETHVECANRKLKFQPNKSLSYSQNPIVKSLTNPSPYNTIQKTNTSPTNSKTTHSSVGSTKQPFPIKHLSQAEMQIRRDKGLCYNCDEPFKFGHRCKSRQIYMLNMDEEDEEIWHDTVEAEIEPQEEKIDEDINVSLHALSGSCGLQTLKLIGWKDKKKFTVLIDSGSTHNFLDPEAARRLGCVMEDSPMVQVTVADGAKVESQEKCTGFQ